MNGHHDAIGSCVQGVNRPCAECDAEVTVECGGRPSPQQMTEDHRTRLFPGQFLELRRHCLSNSAETFAPARLPSLDNDIAADRLGAFRDHNDGIGLPFLMTIQQVCSYL